MRYIFWFLFIVLALSIGVYPMGYLLMDMSQSGFMRAKGAELLASNLWNITFYTHIILGGLALLVGWSQFIDRIRSRKVSLHRTLGKIYLVAVLLSGFCSLYIAFYAIGGIAAQTGFGILGILWLFTTIQAYKTIKKGNTRAHQHWMIRSYALCFAAVTLRLLIPSFMMAQVMSFVEAYRIIAWLCWVPNLIVAELIIWRLRQRSSIALIVVP